MNLKQIRAEIEALYDKDYGENTNALINDVIDLIDSHIEPKSEPTEAGLWQCAKNGVNHIIDVGEDLNYPEYCKGGQWAKVKGI